MSVRMVLGCAVSALVALMVVGGTAGTATSREPPGEPIPAEVDDYVSGYLERHGLPGAAVAVVEHGRTVHEAGYGADAHGRPLTEHARLRLASASKSITAFAVLRLVDDGAIALDDAVTAYLPELEAADERVDEVTVAHLLSHTSGIETPAVLPPAATAREGVARLRGWRLSSEPGTEYAYSNANAWIAARLVEVVGGQPFDDHLRDRVFTPLGMTRTHSAPTTRGAVPGPAPGHVTAYGLAFPADEPEQMVAGAGGVVSTAHDMARWLSVQQRRGTTTDGRQLLPAAAVEQSHRARPGTERAGLGWLRSGPGVEPARVGHSGVFQTFQARTDLVPGSGFGVVVLLGSGSTWREHAYEISSGIIAITEGRDPEAGTPVPTLIDLALGAGALGVAALGLRGVRGAPRWAARRAGRPRWRVALRLLPHLIAPALAGGLLVVGPLLEDNSLTSADILGSAPAPMVLLLTLAVTGTAVIGSRSVALQRARRRGPGDGRGRPARRRARAPGRPWPPRPGRG